ncbi:MAG: response regulator transcription factor, partial [Candidatus Dormibacteria bacterium]
HGRSASVTVNTLDSLSLQKGVKEIGVRLNLSAKTVETHVSSVLRKLQLSSRYELTRWAMDRRMI